MTRLSPKRFSAGSAVDLRRYLGPLRDRGQRDRWHENALRLLEKLLSDGEVLLTHNYVFVESVALVQRRLGVAAALKLAESIGSFEVVWVDETIHREGVKRFARRRHRRLSLVDEVSFLVMTSRGVNVAL